MYNIYISVMLLLRLAILSLYLLGGASVAPADAVSVFSKGEGGYYCHKIPYLYRTSANTLLALAEARGKGGNNCSDFTGTDLVIKRSVDGGQTWSTLTVLASNSSDTESNVVGNAAPVQDSATGRIWMPYCRNNEEVFISYSDDDGITWSAHEYHPELVLPEWKWVGIGPPAGLQLTSGRLLLPGYHTTAYKGDGEISKGHTIYSDDHGVTWSIGSASFGAPYFSNECQAVQLTDGSVLINARVLSTHRIQMRSTDGGLSFDSPVVATGLAESIEGCEGSMVRDGITGILYFSIPYSAGIYRKNMTIFTSVDEGSSWQAYVTVDEGAASYSALQILPDNQALGLLYERSDEMNVIFDPDDMLFWKVPLLQR